MTTTKQIKLLPWDYIISLIFKEFGSKEFYSKFKDWGYALTPEIQKEWRDNYMNPRVWVCSQKEFFDKIPEFQRKYWRKYKSPEFNITMGHILPLCAPLFHEQVITWPLDIAF